MRKVAALLLLCGLAGCASAPAPGRSRATVEAEGWAAETAGHGRDSRARALADAQRRAVEKAAGVRVAAMTRVDEGLTVRQRIWADARGRIESWDILDDRLEDGFRKLRIRAVVRLNEPGDEDPPPPVDAKLRLAVSGPAAVGLRREFGARGFSLVDSGEDYVVTAVSSTRLSRDARLAPFVSGRASLRVAVTDASGAVLWEAMREASGLDADPLLAAARAGEAAGALAGRDAASGLAEALWSR